MLKYASLLRSIKAEIIDRAFVRPAGEGTEAEAALDLIMETVSVLDYDCDYLPGADISAVTNDSREACRDAIFIAIKGARSNGAEFVPQALKKGAKVVISEDDLEDLLLPGTVNLVVKNTYKAYAVLCEAFYDFPTRNMAGFAFTGTNGKTTSAMLTRMLLKHAGQCCGLISTVEYDCGIKIVPADRTTPEAGRLFAMFAEMQQNNVRNFVMEVSSHALHQNRIGTLQFNAAVFTNLTGDHLDYHKTMEEYYQVKKRLFTDHLANGGKAVINIDDSYGKRLAEELPAERVVTFGCNSAQWQITNIQSSAQGSTFTLKTPDIEQRFSIDLPGKYNIYNVSGTVLALHCTGKLPLDRSAEILAENSVTVPGRMESFVLPDGAVAVVDYAHTADALENVLNTLRRIAQQRLLCVFGCGGDRDKSKRPAMGKIAADIADVIYLTSDNPRSEEPAAIIEEIKSGIPQDFAALHTITDRRSAIKTALKNALPGDIVLIAGKGHEDYQEIDGVKHHFDDREEVRNFR